MSEIRAALALVSMGDELKESSRRLAKASLSAYESAFELLPNGTDLVWVNTKENCHVRLVGFIWIPITPEIKVTNEWVKEQFVRGNLIFKEVVA